MCIIDKVKGALVIVGEDCLSNKIDNSKISKKT